MILEFLSSNSQFAAVKYNSDKLSCGKAELMSARNFQALAVISKPRAADFKSYLQMIGSLNPKVKNKQLHVSIMAKGLSRDKYELTDIAHRWLKKMGYANNPYLIYFHNDNPNNHVHIVSVRVCKNRKSVPTCYEKFRASVALHELIGFDPVAQAKIDADRALTYGFSSIDQFLILLKSIGYSGYIKNSALYMVRHYRTLYSINLDSINSLALRYQPSQNAIQAMKKIFALFLRIAGGDPVRHPSFWHSYLKNSYKSDLGVLLFDKLNINVIYHTKDKKAVGFTIVNHNTRQVHNGDEIVDFETLIRNLKHPEAYIQGDRVFFYEEENVKNTIWPQREPGNLAVGKLEVESEKRRLGR
jgi:hypothetical protein